MKIKFNWGTGILIVFIIFMVSVLTQVFFYMNTNVDLVTDNYYERELAYQDHIIKVKNTENLSEQIIIKNSSGELNVNFPQGYSAEKIKGSILFYRPSDPSKDITLNLKLDDQNTQKIKTSNFINGYWKIKLNWEYGSDSYYHEQTLIIN